MSRELRIAVLASILGLAGLVVGIVAISQGSNPDDEWVRNRALTPVSTSAVNRDSDCCNQNKARIDALETKVQVLEGELSLLKQHEPAPSAQGEQSLQDQILSYCSIHSGNNEAHAECVGESIIGMYADDAEKVVSAAGHGYLDIPNADWTMGACNPAKYTYGFLPGTRYLIRTSSWTTFTGSVSDKYPFSKVVSFELIQEGLDVSQQFPCKN